MSLYPSLEDMVVDKMAQAQVETGKTIVRQTNNLISQANASAQPAAIAVSTSIRPFPFRGPPLRKPPFVP